MTNLRLDLSKMDADISIWPLRDPPDQLIGRKACNLVFAAYSTASRKEDS